MDRINILNLNIKGSISINYFISVFSISSSKLIFIFFMSLSNKLPTKLKTFFEYKLEAETGSLLRYFFLHYSNPIISTISSTL